MAQDALGGRAAQYIEDAVVSRRRHSNKISIDLGSGLQDRFDRVSPPNLHVHRHYGLRCALQDWRMRPNMKKMDGEIVAGERMHEFANRVDRCRRRGCVVNGNEHAAQPQLATQLIDKASGTWRNEQGRLRGTARHDLGDRAMEPARRPIAAMSCEHDEFGRMPVDKTLDSVNGILRTEADLDHFDAELCFDRRLRISLGWVVGHEFP